MKKISIACIIICTIAVLGFFWYQFFYAPKNTEPFYGDISLYVNSVQDVLEQVKEHASSFGVTIVSSTPIVSTAMQASIIVSLKYEDAPQFLDWLTGQSTDGYIIGSKSVFPVDRDISDDVSGTINIRFIHTDFL
jgi:hypothetical protein